MLLMLNVTIIPSALTSWASLLNTVQSRSTLRQFKRRTMIFQKPRAMNTTASSLIWQKTDFILPMAIIATPAITRATPVQRTIMLCTNGLTVRQPMTTLMKCLMTTGLRMLKLFWASIGLNILKKPTEISNGLSLPIFTLFSTVKRVQSNLQTSTA